jgi:hypothetical protein
MFFFLSADIDPEAPTTFERYLQVFAEDDTKILDDSNLKNIAYYKCRQCELLKFDKYISYKEHVFKKHRLLSISDTNKTKVVLAPGKL